jgi:hypothetical protein
MKALIAHSYATPNRRSTSTPSVDQEEPEERASTDLHRWTGRQLVTKLNPTDVHEVESMDESMTVAASESCFAGASHDGHLASKSGAIREPSRR